MFNSSQILSRTDVRQIDNSQSLPSTSDKAIELIRDDATDYPLLVVTQIQTAGRGTLGRSWQSDRGSLTFTYGLPIESTSRQDGEISLPGDQQNLIPLATAIAICEVLEADFSLRPEIKWPNDVLIQGFKVAGILSEKIARRDLAIAAIGIGINVANRIETEEIDAACNIDRFSFSPTRLADWIDQTIDIQEVLIHLLNRMSETYLSMWNRPQKISRLANDRLFRIGQTVKIQPPGVDPQVAEIVEISTDGSLLVNSDLGRQTIRSGRLVRWQHDEAM